MRPKAQRPQKQSTTFYYTHSKHYAHLMHHKLNGACDNGSRTSLLRHQKPTSCHPVPSTPNHHILFILFIVHILHPSSCVTARAHSHDSAPRHAARPQAHNLTSCLRAARPARATHALLFRCAEEDAGKSKTLGAGTGQGGVGQRPTTTDLS